MHCVVIFFSISLSKRKKSQLIIFTSESCSSLQRVWEVMVPDLMRLPSSAH